jgi:hypothetical protein
LGGRGEAIPYCLGKSLTALMSDYIAGYKSEGKGGGERGGVKRRERGVHPLRESPTENKTK